ncbi:MAG: hypothetical protein AAB399_01370 [Patescibacteria group bacterium]
MKKQKVNKGIKQIIDLDRKIKNLPELSRVEKSILEQEQKFDSVYYSNKLEGNKLSKEEARKAILAND